MPGSSTYPGTLDNFAAASPTNLADSDATGRTHSERHDDVEAAMEAVQAELGTDPAGASATVKARFDVIEANSWVSTARIADNAVTTPKLSIAYANAAALPAGALGDIAFQSDTEAALVYRGSAWRRIAPRSALYLPGTSGNYVSCPDSAGVSITGDIDVRVKVALSDWTPASAQCFLSKWTPSGNQRSWRFEVDTLGQLVFTWSTDGSATASETSSAATGIADGAVKWVRVTLDVDNGAAGRTARFYVADDDSGTTWTQLGTAKTTAGVTSIYDSTAVLEVGSITVGTNNLAVGKFYRASVLNGIDGSTVASPDFRLPVAPRMRDGQGNVWTFNGSAYSWMIDEAA